VKKNEKDADSESQSCGRHVRTERRKSLVGLAFLLSHSLREILGDLKWPFVLGALTANTFCIFGAIGLGISLPLPVLSVAGSFLVYLVIVESPIIYFVWRRIKHDDSISRIMSEAYETDGRPIAEKVDEYKALIDKQKS